MYVPEWESIANSAQWLIASGMSEEDARTGICHAISDRKIRLRAVVGTDDYFTAEGDDIADGEIKPPLRLKPTDIDWQGSKPMGCWECLDHHEARRRSISLLELSTSDLEALFPRSKGIRTRSPKRLPMARSEKVRIFKEWRVSRGKNIPTIKEDTEYMRGYGVSRDEVREFRKDYPNRSPGRPKRKPASA
jgi:hypothetical protein